MPQFLPGLQPTLFHQGSWKAQDSVMPICHQPPLRRTNARETDKHPGKLGAVDSCLLSTPGLVLTQAQQWIPASASSVTFGSGLTSSCLQQLRGPATVLCSSQLHLTLWPLLLQQTAQSRCQAESVSSPRLSYLAPPTPAALHPLVVLGQRCRAECQDTSPTGCCTALQHPRAETGGLALAVLCVKVHERATHRCTAAQTPCLPFAASLRQS